MSAPETNIEKQTRQHRVPLAGIILSMVFVGLLFVGWLLYGVGGEETEENTAATPPETTAPAADAETTAPGVDATTPAEDTSGN